VKWDWKLAAPPMRFADLPRLPRDTEGPVFVEPWHAQVFALTMQLHETGYFSWAEWTAALTAELRRTDDAGGPDDGMHYYERWLVALEGLVAVKGLTDDATLLRRKEDWVEAHRSTPHGQPVELKS
jgi:nitrile hydratase accessory protein